jgi:hypothetical protein
MLAPLHGRSRAAPEDDGKSRGGWIGGRLGGVKREDGEARGGDDREGLNAAQGRTTVSVWCWPGVQVVGQASGCLYV